MTLSLGTSTDRAARPRHLGHGWSRAADGARRPDPELEASYLQFGRYLMISGSRDSAPLNLQGLWLDGNDPDWMGDYHTDINVQMNYWMADRTGLSDCFDALTDYCLAQLPVLDASVTQQAVQRPAQPVPQLLGQGRGLDRRVLHQHPRRLGLVVASGRQRLAVQHPLRALRVHPGHGDLDRDLPAAEGRLRVLGVPAGHHDRHRPGDREAAATYWSTTRTGRRSTGRRTPGAHVRPGTGLGALRATTASAAEVLGRDAGYSRHRSAACRSGCTCRRSARRPGWLEEWMSPDNLGETDHRHLSPLIGLFPGDRIRPARPAGRILAGARRPAHRTGHGQLRLGQRLAGAVLGPAEGRRRRHTSWSDNLRPSVGDGNGTAHEPLRHLPGRARPGHLPDRRELRHAVGHDRDARLRPAPATSSCCPRCRGPGRVGARDRGRCPRRLRRRPLLARRHARPGAVTSVGGRTTTVSWRGSSRTVTLRPGKSVTLRDFG